MIKADHPIRTLVQHMPSEHDNLICALNEVKHLLNQYNWHINTGALAHLFGDNGCYFYSVFTNSGIVGGIFVAWTTTFEGRVRFMAEIIRENKG